MAKEKTVLFVMPRLPFPTSSGRKTSLYHYCRILSEKLGYRIVVVAFLEEGDGPDNKPEFIDRLVVLPKAGIATRGLNILKKTFLQRKSPMQVSLYWNKKAKNIVDEIFDEEKPVVVIGDMVRSTDYIRDLPCFRVADLDDRISLRYQRELDTDLDGINPYGAFLRSFPSSIRRIMLLKPVKLFVVKNEIALLRKYEIEVGKACDRTVFVAEKEASDFNQEIGQNKAIAVPIGVDVDYFTYRECKNEDNIIGFLGAMSVAHNENAVRHFVQDIFPLVLKKVPNANFMVIGGGASEKLNSLESDSVHFTGRVEDVRDYLAQCKVFVCPMTFGSGIKTKNLEAMAMGLPVVTTLIGAENIGAKNNIDWIIADTDVDFADAVTTLLQDTELRRTISLEGSQYIRQNFTWNVACNRLSLLLEKTEISKA